VPLSAITPKTLAMIDKASSVPRYGIKAVRRAPWQGRSRMTIPSQNLPRARQKRYTGTTPRQAVGHHHHGLARQTPAAPFPPCRRCDVRPKNENLPIEDYALIGNTITGALVGKNGSIDWFCAPRLDSAACFAALLGDRDNGHWQIAPADGTWTVRRRYRDNTLILETEFETSQGCARLTDFMVMNGHDSEEHCRLVRIVEG